MFGDTKEPKPKFELTKEECAVILAGYIRGIWVKHGEKPDRIILNALRKVGCPERYLQL